MKSVRLATPFLALALAALPAVSLHAQQSNPPQGDPQPQQDNQRDQNSAQRNPWDTPPPQLHDIGRRGYQDGIEAARNDMNSHHPMDAQRSQMYRHPPVRRHERNDYRQGFTQGYQRSMQHQHNGDDHHDGAPQ